MDSLSPGRNLPGEASDIIEGSALFQSVENPTAPAPSFHTDKWLLLSLWSSHRQCSGEGKEFRYSGKEMPVSLTFGDWVSYFGLFLWRPYSTKSVDSGDRSVGWLMGTLLCRRHSCFSIAWLLVTVGRMRLDNVLPGILTGGAAVVRPVQLDTLALFFVLCRRYRRPAVLRLLRVTV